MVIGTLTVNIIEYHVIKAQKQPGQLLMYSKKQFQSQTPLTGRV
jgi:hypothetical protein